MSQVTCVVACHPGDWNQAIRLFDWCAELGRVHAPLLLICSDECPIPELMRHANMAFDSVVLELDTEKVRSDWSAPEAGPKSAAGPNSLFRKAAWYFHMAKPGPFFWLEPDAIPLCRDWFDILVAEYRQSQKPFMGALIQSPNRINDKHMSGTGMYDQRTPAIMVDAMKAVDVAFDVASANVVLENAHITTRISDHYRPKPFESMADVTARIPDGAVLYHSNKGGELIPFIRQKLGMTAKAEALYRGTSFEHGPWAVTESTSMSVIPPAATPVVDIYLKTYPKDYELAHYCLKSIAKFVTGHRRVIIEAPDRVVNEPDERITWVDSDDRHPGYIDQQAKKLAAFKHTDADYLLYADSDCCFQRPFDVREMFKDGKSTWQYTPFTDARDDQKSAWQPVMEKFLGKPSPNEFMRRHPHILPRWLPEEMDKFCRYRHGKSLDEYIMAQADPQQPLALAFSEFNCAGFFAWEFFRDRIAWVTDAEATPAPLVQGFTHGGPERIQNDIAQFRKILEEPSLYEACYPTPAGTGHLPPLDAALAVLAAEASQSPGHKGRLIRKFNSVMATVKPKMAKAPEGFGKGRKRKKNTGFLLCIHTFPGANNALARHWPQFEKSGASEIVVITTNDGGCLVPEGVRSEEIGINSYINGPVLPKRMADTLRFCLSTDYDQYVIAEWDTILLGPLKLTGGMMLHETGGQLPGAMAKMFSHNPWIFNRYSAERVAAELDRMVAENFFLKHRPECSPDVALGYVVGTHTPALTWTPIPPSSMYTRNSLSEPGALGDAVKAVRNGAMIIHGVKTKDQYEALLNALDNKPLGEHKA